MPIITGPAGMDPVLGEMRTINISGGTGGGGDNYTFNTTEFSVGIAGLVSLNQVPGNKVSGTASVEDVQTGGAQRLVDVSALRGALTAGQAVDVTSCPDGVTGDYRGTINVSSSVLNFGFASFPKYAAGLTYLMIADITPVSDMTVGPGGSWLDGDRTGKVIAGGTTTRIAMLFTAADEGYFNFGSNHGDVSISNLREYEVTACTPEAIAYIAALSNPDAFTSYYLVKSDMVQPWTYIIDMGTSPAVTIASGLSYKLNASTGTHQLTVDTCPEGYDGRDAIIRIRLGGSGVIQAVAPLQLGGALVPYAINNCVVRFRDGEAVLLVEDTLAGYVVTVNTGTGEGSLPYALAANGVPYIAFSPSTDGIPVELSGATTAAEEVTVVGNGYTDTILTGGVSCTGKTTFANLSMQGVTVTGGTMTLGDVYIPSGSTVAVSGGGLAVEKVTGNGGVIDLGGTGIIQSGGTVVLHGLTISGGSYHDGGALYIYTDTAADISGCVFSGNRVSAGGGAIYTRTGTTATIIDTTISGNSAGTGFGGGMITGGNTFVSNSLISGNSGGNGFEIMLTGGTMTLLGSTVGNVGARTSSKTALLALSGSNSLTKYTSRNASEGGRCSIASGAVVSLTSSIQPGGDIIVDAVCYVNGATVTGGTYTKINSDGTTVPPQPA